MAAIDDNELRPEEKIGGFNSETPGDDTFFSENQDVYPGTMPDYSEYEDESPVSESEPPATEKPISAAAVEPPVNSNKKRPLLKILIIAAIIALLVAAVADIYMSSTEEKTETIDEQLYPVSSEIEGIEEIPEIDPNVYSESVIEIENVEELEPVTIEDEFLTEMPQTPVEPIETGKKTQPNKPIQTSSKKSEPGKVAPIDRPKPAGGRLYTVQVYSSPSKDDAEVWLARLIKKNVGKAFITTKMIRNTMMYRVRFGAFSTQAEAKKAAVKQGFDQTWIDRVR